jgi:hypothetical protein
MPGEGGASGNHPGRDGLLDRPPARAMTTGGSLSESVGITYSWSMIFFGKPVPTFPDHALASHLDDDVKIAARPSDAVERGQMLFWILDAPSGCRHECARPQAQGEHERRYSADRRAPETPNSMHSRA